jgi:hypothetical protein
MKIGYSGNTIDAEISIKLVKNLGKTYRILASFASPQTSLLKVTVSPVSSQPG